jgi:hypothetical protein
MLLVQKNKIVSLRIQYQSIKNCHQNLLINSKTGILEDSKYSVDPALQPTFVHITRDNSKVIIGLCGIRRKYAVLIVMDKDGQHQEMVLDHDKIK